MEEETKIWKLVMTAICTVIALIGGCSATINYQDNKAMIDMVNSGADPIDSKCAIKGTSEISVCAIRAATKNK